MIPTRIMIFDDMIADLDQVHDHLVDQLHAGANDERDHLGRLADAVAAAANLLFALKYDSQSNYTNGGNS
jgi:hypothetical protein